MSRWPIRDYNHRTTTDMWLYRAYSGSLYHGGELGRALPSFTQGDTITCILDMEARTISFAKNNKVWSTQTRVDPTRLWVNWDVLGRGRRCLVSSCTAAR